MQAFLDGPANERVPRKYPNSMWARPPPVTFGLEPPQFEQPQYNMMHRRRFESEYFPLFAPPYNFGTTIWSPLASGLLTGKYAGGAIPAGSRAAAKGYEFIGAKVNQWKEDGSLAKVAALAEFAETELGCSVAQLAIAWCLKNPKVTTVLLLLDRHFHGAFVGVGGASVGGAGGGDGDAGRHISYKYDLKGLLPGRTGSMEKGASESKD